MTMRYQRWTELQDANVAAVYLARSHRLFIEQQRVFRSGQTFCDHPATPTCAGRLEKKF